MEKGNKFLKVTGILMIISGAINLLGSVLLLLFGVLFVDAAVHANLTGAKEVAAGLIVAGIVFIIIASIVQFLTGLFGVKNAKNPEKANVCILFGVLTVVIYVVSQILNFMGGAIHNYLDVMIVVFGLVIPALYLVGAFQLKAKED